MTVSVLDDPRFSFRELTSAINVFPRSWSLIQSLGVFGAVPTPIDSTFVTVYQSKTGLGLIPAKSRNGDTNHIIGQRDKQITIQVPHLPLDDAINPEDMQNLLMFQANATNQAMDPATNFQQKVVQKLQVLSRSHDFTHEYYRAKALNGFIKDADGTTLVDLYTLFGLTRANFVKAVDLGTSTTDVRGIYSDTNELVLDKASDDSVGLVQSGFNVTSYALCSQAYWNLLINHDTVKDAYQFQQGLQNQPLTQDLKQTGFIFGGVWHFLYTAKDPVSGDLFVPAKSAFLFPAGTSNSFEEYAAPANYNDTVNTMGQEKYAKIVPAANDKGAKLESQSNRLALAKRPDTMFEMQTP